MNRSRSARTVGALLLCLLVALPLRAEMAPKWTDAELARLASVILTGRVARIASGWDGDTIYTYVTLDVADVLKGNVADKQIVIKQLGGRVGDRALIISGQATFSAGE